MIDEICVFCNLPAIIRGHHLIPKSKGGEIIVPTCETCESFIHKTWNHKELRDTYNTVELIIQSDKFKSFLKWRLKRPTTTIFKSVRGKFRDKNKFH